MYSTDGWIGTFGKVPVITDNHFLTAGVKTTLNTGYVDLDLPSGTLWANYNVGAETPESFGNYFAWGETAPKDSYGWETYEWCRGSYNTLTKYNNSSTYGDVDNQEILLIEDDAASANWGSNWAMPTSSQMMELCNAENCIWVWTNTSSGVGGYTFTSKTNGISIFIPAAGNYGQSGYTDRNMCNYWQSEIYRNRPDKAWELFGRLGSNTGVEVLAVDRYCGCSVRPVRLSTK